MAEKNAEKGVEDDGLGHLRRRCSCHEDVAFNLEMEDDIQVEEQEYLEG